MKKKLEAELISIAHRILKLKNKSDIVSLHQETQKLYEKLSVLRFVEENFGDVKPTIGQADIESKLESAFDYNDKIVIEELPADEPETVPAAANEISEIIGNLASKPEVNEEPEAVAGTEAKPEETIEEEITAEEPEMIDAPEQPETVAEVEAVEEVAEIEEEETIIPAELNEEPAAETEETPEAEPEKEEVAEEKKPEEYFAPSFELAFDPKTDDAVEIAKDPTPQFSFDDLLGKDYVEPVFVKPEDLQQSFEAEKPKEPEFTEAPKSEEKENVIPISRSANDGIQVIPINKSENKSISLNDRLSKGITIGLNDRIAFMKHLFANSSEDYNRVLSQLITFDTFDEAKNFIDDMVKPDYNNWEGKDEYAGRFMEIVEKRFS